jgi:hypothetical protein
MYRDPNAGNLVIEGARLIFRNFAGKEGMYNREGDRNFSVLLDDELAEAMTRDGWNVKYLKSKEADEEPQAYIQVSVGFKGRPPNMTLITHNGRTALGEDECEIFDLIDIENVDLIIRPYEWAVNGKSGVKAYLKTIFVKILEDPLQLKYAHLEELPTSSGKVYELPVGPQVTVIDGEWKE